MDLIMGMNSGSSFDGIDVILAETELEQDGVPISPRYICGGSYDWPEEVEVIVRNAFENRVDMVGMNRLNYIIGAVFAEKAVQFMKENNIKPLDVKVLGLDTQTIYQEQPDHAKIAVMTEDEKTDWLHRWLNGPYPAGMQMGVASVIANFTNIYTVTHFRPADHVWGGAATGNVALAVTGALATGAVVGLANGTLCAVGKLPGFIASLASMTILRGLAYIVTGGNSVVWKNEQFTMIGTGYVGVIPVPVIIMVIVIIWNYSNHKDSFWALCLCSGW